MKALGVKMNVPSGEMSGAFEGVNASTYAVELGSHVQRIAPYDKPTWSVVDEGTKEAVYVAASFDFSDWKTDQAVKMVVHKLAMHIYREFRSEPQRKYKQLLGEGNDRRQYPPDPQMAAQWLSMIEQRWETSEWKQQSHRNSMIQRQVKTTHSSDSQSFAQRLAIIPAEEVPSTQSGITPATTLEQEDEQVDHTLC